MKSTCLTHVYYYSFNIYIDDLKIINNKLVTYIYFVLSLVQVLYHVILQTNERALFKER